MFKHDLSLETIKDGLRHPFAAFDEIVLQHLVRVPATALNSRWRIGENVFSRQWDALVILDTCRVDALREVAPEYDFLGPIGSIRSVGGATPEWIAATFTDAHVEQTRRTCYLSGTAQARGVLEERLPSRRSLSESHLTYKLLSRFDTVDIDDVGRVEYLFEYDSEDDRSRFGHPGGLTPPRYVTDRGVAVGREGDFERIVLHYMQPHSPYVANAAREDRDLEPHEADPLRYLRETGDRGPVWESYLDELRSVLDEVAVFVENFDGDVAITADHGEAFGEWGIYGHMIGSLHPNVRTVPWVTTAASDSGTHSPTVDSFDDRTGTDGTTEEILESLGYKF